MHPTLASSPVLLCTHGSSIRTDMDIILLARSLETTRTKRASGPACILCCAACCAHTRVRSLAGHSQVQGKYTHKHTDPTTQGSLRDARRDARTGETASRRTDTYTYGSVFPSFKESRASQADNIAEPAGTRAKSMGTPGASSTSCAWPHRGADYSISFSRWQRG